MLNPAARLRTIGCLAAFVCTPGVSRHLSLRLIFRRSYICVKRRSGRQDSSCRPVCEKKLYEKHLLFTSLTIQMNCEGFMVEM